MVAGWTEIFYRLAVEGNLMMVIWCYEDNRSEDDSKTIK